MYNEDKFDQMIRSTLLEGGQEEVPPTLWDAVLSRMAEAEKISGRKRFFRIFASVAAALCCISAAILLIPSIYAPEPDSPVAVVKNPQRPVPDEESSSSSVEGILVENSLNYSAESSAVAKNTAGFDDLPVDGDRSESLSDNASDKALVNAEDKAVDKALDKAVDNAVDKAGETILSAALNTFSDAAYDADFPEESDMEKTRVQLWGNVTGAGNTGRHSSFIGRRASAGSFNFGSEGNITETENIFYMVPISAGVGIKVHFNKRLALGTGINYAFLSRRLNGQYDEGGIENQAVENITNNQHYIGIPLNVYYNFAQTSRLSFYVYLGGEAQKCVSNSFSFNYAGYDKSLQKKVSGIQWSIGAGVGMQVAISDLVSLYLDPNVQYYFKNLSQPKSIRTTQPFQLGCNIGLRFNL